MIQQYEQKDLPRCAEIMMAVYNNEQWQCRWTMETASAYMREYLHNPRFVGFTVWEDDQMIGATFCHERTWWTQDELFMDECFIMPAYQRKGYGSGLIEYLEEYVREHALAGITLLTNKYTPAPDFYRKNGFDQAEHVIFMYKVMEA